jgi:NADH:ubiquinone oxidoreductase subunit K
MEIWILVFWYFCGLASYLMCGGHVLLMLLRLEFIVVSVFVMFFCSVRMMVGLYYLLLYFLVIVVCESSLGLCLLVGAVRSFGRDEVYSFVSC